MAGKYALAPGISIFSAGRLPPAVQVAAGVRTGQFAVTMVDGRLSTRLIDGDTVELLRSFERQPGTLVQAILDFAAAHDADPGVVLELAYPALRALISDGLLVPVSGDDQDGDPGEAGSFGDFTVIQAVQRLADTVVYKARTPAGEHAAVKVLRNSGISRLRPMLSREAAVLAYAEGCAVPGLLYDGSADDIPFLGLQWMDGRLITDHAAAVRRPWDTAARRALLGLSVSLIEAYAGLHERGIVHADVHPKNVLVGPDGKVTIIDFGFACAAGVTHPGVARAGVMAFWEPEWAEAVSAGRPAPAATKASDQFALGALLYLVLTGSHHVDPIGGVPEVLTRIIQDPPRAFEEHGGPAWPGVEAVLARMLAKRPGDRFADLQAAARALRAELEAATSSPSARKNRPGRPVLEDLLDVTTRRLSREGGVIDTGLPTSPRVSVNYGAAGVAYFFYRLAVLRQEPQHLLTAVRWATLAHRQRNDPLAYHDRTQSVLPERVGRVSIYHSPAGTALVRALVASALGDLPAAIDACAAYVVASGHSCDGIDVTVGRASTVLGATLLVEALGGTGVPEQVSLAELADRTLSSIMREMPATIAGDDAVRFRGIAHGWAGLLYTALRWCEATRARIPDQLLSRLNELAELEHIRHGQSSWAGPNDPMLGGGWCHGTAGYTQLWAVAARVVDETRYGPLAERAAAAAWTAPASAVHLCCGLAGQAYAMLAAYELSDEVRWLRRAEDLAARAVAGAAPRTCLPNSLWKGDVGLACLAADLDAPAEASMPLFGREGWPAVRPDTEWRDLPL